MLAKCNLISLQVAGNIEQRKNAECSRIRSVKNTKVCPLLEK